MKKFSKITLVFSFLFLLLPLLFTPATMFPWLFGKTILFQIFLEILAIIFFFLVWKENSFEIKKFTTLDKTVYAFLAALFITGVCGVNFFQSFWPTQMRSLGIFTWLHFGVWYFFLTQFIKTENEWKKCLGVSTQVAVLVGLTGVFQSFLPTFWRGDIGGERFSGILGNPAFFASYILVHIGIAFFLSREFAGKWRYLLGAEGIFLAVCVLMSGIRGAALGLVVGGMFWLAVKLFQKSTNKKSLWLKVGLVGAVVLVATLFGVIKNSPLKNQLPASIVRLFDYSLSSGTGATRLMAWKIAWEGWKEKPLLGWGWGNYERVFNTHYNPEFLRYGFQETVWDKPHNSVLEMMMSMGVWSVLYVLVFVLASGVLFINAIKKTSVSADRYTLLGATLMAYLVQAAFLFETTNVLFALIVVLSFVSFHSRTQHDEKLKKVTVPFFVSLLGMGIGVWCIFINIVFLTTSHAVKQVFAARTPQAFSEAVKEALQAKAVLKTESAILIADQLTKIEKSGALHKDNVAQWKESALLTAQTLQYSFAANKKDSSAATWSAQVYMILGQFDDEKYYDTAVEMLEAAHTLSPQKQEIVFLLNRVYLLKKDFAKAVEWGQKAVEINPTIAISHWFLGLAKVAGGDVAGGLASVDTAFALKYYPNVNERLYIIDLYTEQKQYNKVVEQYKILLEADKENVNWYIKLATAYALVGDKENALEMVRQAKILYPPVSADADAFVKQYHLE